jgi:hypothetical protein
MTCCSETRSGRWRLRDVRRGVWLGSTGLDGLAAHRAVSDRERSFATAIASRLDRCCDGLRMISIGLPRSRQDMIARGELTAREATVDIEMAMQMLRH